MDNRLPAQLKQRFTSEVLWHFTGRNKSEDEAYERMVSILRTGRLKASQEEVEFRFVNVNTKDLQKLAGHPVCCLADIPFKDLHIHAERYKRHALGFHKESVIGNHFQPILYVNQYADFFPRFMQAKAELEAAMNGSETAAKKFEDLMRLLASVMKSGDLKSNPVDNPDWDQLQTNNFYYEREWRSLHDWNFTPDDLALIVLPDEKLADFMKIKKDLRIAETTSVIPFSMVYRL